MFMYTLALLALHCIASHAAPAATFAARDEKHSLPWVGLCGQMTCWHVLGC